MALFAITCALSSILLVWLFIVCVGFIVFKRIKLGRLEPVRNYIWSREVFGPGKAIVRKYPWILLLCLLARAASFADHFPANYMFIRTHPHLYVSSVGHKTLKLASVFWTLVYAVPSLFVRATFDLRSALPSDGSTLVAAVCLFAAMFVLLPPKSASPSSVHSHGYLKPSWGLAAGFLGIILVWCWMMDARVALGVKPAGPAWIVIVSGLFSTFVIAYADAAILCVLKAAAEGREISAFETLSEAKSFSGALFLFSLVYVGIKIAAGLPVFFQPPGGFQSEGVARIWLWVGESEYLFAGLLAFIPVIIVVRGDSFVKAFRRCINVWARQPRNAATFVFLSTLLVLGPNMVRERPYWFLKGGPWTAQFVRFTGSCLTMVASVLVLSSMMIFYKKVEDTERESLERQERIRTGILSTSKLGTTGGPMGKGGEIGK